MLTRINKHKFELLDDDLLCSVMMEHILLQVRGKSMTVKKDMYDRLTCGQKALFLYLVLFNHARHSVSEFYWFFSYYAADREGWPAFLDALRTFGDDRMLDVYVETEAALEDRNHRFARPWKEATVLDLDVDGTLRQAMESLYGRYLEAAGETEALIAAYIRSHPDEFVEWEPGEG